MVEILGVLAVIGVLSVAGIAGFKNAMDKNRANTLIQEAQKRAVIVAGQIGFNNQTPSLAEFEPYNTTSAGTFGDVITKGLTNQFGIQVSNVNKSICQNILNTIGDKTPIRRLSYETTPTTPITTCKEEDDFLIVYNNDMMGDDKVEEPTICRTVNDCKTSCATCEIPEDEEVGICTEECEEPTKLCTVDTECNQTNECMVCDTKEGLCKDGCERVEYLEGNGSQYIDTGVPGKSSYIYRITAGWYIINSEYSTGLFGSAWSENAVFVQMNSAGDSEARGKTYWHGMKNPDYINSLIERYSEMEFGNGYRIDDGVETRTSTNITSNTNKSVKIFGINSSNSTKVRITSFKIIDDKGKAVLDLVPVHASFKTDGKQNCMLNRVPEDGKLKLYCNSGSGDFKTNKD